MNRKTQKKAIVLLKSVADELFSLSYDLLEEMSYLYYNEPTEINGEQLKELFAVHGEVNNISTDIKQYLSRAGYEEREP